MYFICKNNNSSFIKGSFHEISIVWFCPCFETVHHRLKWQQCVRCVFFIWSLMLLQLTFSAVTGYIYTRPETPVLWDCTKCETWSWHLLFFFFFFHISSYSAMYVLQVHCGIYSLALDLFCVLMHVQWYFLVLCCMKLFLHTK